MPFKLEGVGHVATGKMNTRPASCPQAALGNGPTHATGKCSGHDILRGQAMAIERTPQTISIPP